MDKARGVFLKFSSSGGKKGSQSNCTIFGGQSRGVDGVVSWSELPVPSCPGSPSLGLGRFSRAPSASVASPRSSRDTFKALDLGRFSRCLMRRLLHPGQVNLPTPRSSRDAFASLGLGRFSQRLLQPRPCQVNLARRGSCYHLWFAVKKVLINSAGIFFRQCVCVSRHKHTYIMYMYTETHTIIYLYTHNHSWVCV